MKFPHRRQFLHLAAGAAALPLSPAHSRGAILSVTAGTLDCRVCPRRRKRHRRASDGSMAIGADRPAIHHREPAGCGYQHRRRGRRECVP